MQTVFPVNIHNKSGTMLLSLAFKSEEKALQLLELVKTETNANLLQITDDFGHEVIIYRETIGFLIYVDQLKDSELGRHINERVDSARRSQELRETLTN